MTDADVAIELVAAGAEIVRRSYGTDLARIAKGGGDFATSADIEAEAAHFAAGIAICEAAGCIGTDVFGDAWGRGPAGLLAAADAETHESLLRLTRSRLQ